MEEDSRGGRTYGRTSGRNITSTRYRIDHDRQGHSPTVWIPKRLHRDVSKQAFRNRFSYAISNHPTYEYADLDPLNTKPSQLNSHSLDDSNL